MPTVPDSLAAVLLQPRVKMSDPALLAMPGQLSEEDASFLGVFGEPEPDVSQMPLPPDPVDQSPDVQESASDPLVLLYAATSKVPAAAPRTESGNLQTTSAVGSSPQAAMSADTISVLKVPSEPVTPEGARHVPSGIEPEGSEKAQGTFDPGKAPEPRKQADVLNEKRPEAQVVQTSQTPSTRSDRHELHFTKAALPEPEPLQVDKPQALPRHSIGELQPVMPQQNALKVTEKPEKSGGVSAEVSVSTSISASPSAEIRLSAPTMQPLAAQVKGDAPQPVSAQVVDAIRLTRDGTVDVALSPEDLGRVRLVMQGSDTGMQVHIQSERQDTLDLLRRNIEQLRQELNQAGFGDVTFNFGDRPTDTAQSTEPVAESTEAAGEELQAPQIALASSNEVENVLSQRLNLRL